MCPVTVVSQCAQPLTTFFCPIRTRVFHNYPQAGWLCTPVRSALPVQRTPIISGICINTTPPDSGSGPLEQQRRLLLPPRPPGLRARVTAERLLKGAAALGLRLRLPAAPTPGQSGRGPEAGGGADLWVMELGSRKELKNGSTRGGLRWDSARAHLAWNSVRFRVFPKQVTELASGATV